MSRMAGYIIKSDFSEKQIEADVATYLGWCTPAGQTSPFRLFDVDEIETGADKRFNAAIAIFMQFKVSNGLLAASKSSVRKNRSRLEDIRDYRRVHDLHHDPSLYFQLRAPAKNAKDFQHNVLLKYNKANVSRGIYVAPLHLRHQDYEQALFDSSSRFIASPFFYEDLVIHSPSWTRVYKLIPFLRAHISIVPHESVSSHDHYYSYSRNGSEVVWHSPDVVSEGPSRLSDFMADLLSGITESQSDGLSVEFLANELDEISFGFGRIDRERPQSPSTRLRRHGQWIKEEFGIRQYILSYDTARIRPR